MRVRSTFVAGTLIATVGAVLAPSAGAAAACTFSTVGTTMTLQASCVTTSTIVVPDGMTLNGGGKTITAQDPPGGHWVGAVVKSGGATMNITKLTIKGSKFANVCDADVPSYLRGILFDNAGGSVTSSKIIGMNQGTGSTCLEGNGIVVNNAPFDGSHPAPKAVTLSANQITGFQRFGIIVSGDVNATVTRNKVVAAAYDFTGGNRVAIVMQNGALGNVSSNTADTGTTFGGHAGIQGFAVSGVTFSKNKVAHTGTGIIVNVSCAPVPAADNNVITGNQVSALLIGVDVAAQISGSSTTCSAHANHNSITKNTFTRDTSKPAPTSTVGARILVDSGAFSPQADGTTITSNTFKGWQSPLSDQGTNTVFSGNTVIP